VISDRRVERWIWAAPLVFLIHDSEEIATIVPWLQVHRTQLPAILQPITTISTQQFALAVGVLFVGMLLAAMHGVLRARRGARSVPFLLVAGALIGNGVTHVMQAIYFGEYTPGLATAVLLVLPYGVLLGRAMEASRLESWRTWLSAIAVGAVIQVPIVAALLLAVRS
jgi:hypothetical protein